MRLLWCWLMLACFTGPAWSAEPVEADATDEAAEVEDPRHLAGLAAMALFEGDKATARARFKSMLERQEVARYLPYRAVLREALLLERLGEIDASAAKYRESFDDDVHRTIQVLRILSIHPQRDDLVGEAYEHVRALVAKVEAGEQAQIYTTSKGAPRYLTKMDTDDVLRLAAAGKSARYCYVERLDLTGREDLPERVQLERCVVGSILIPDLEMKQFIFRGIALGDVNLGKTWEGDRNKSKTIKASRFEDLVFRDAIFVGTANFSDVEITDGRAYFPMAVFEGEADFKGAEFWGDTEFRFASFGAGANFRNLRMHAPVYFGNSRYRADTVFTGLFSERVVYFNSVVFEGAVSFDDCEFERGATFENAEFSSAANFETSAVAESLNLSRARFRGEVNVKDVELGQLDAFGVHFEKDAWFTDAIIHGRTRFSLDEVTRHALRQRIDSLLPLYRHYQGDEDADAPLTSRSSYGVISVDDLNTKIDGNISFANVVFGGYTVFEGVVFGREDKGQVASFFNSQFLGETHFEHTRWPAQADFTTIFGNEVAFNGAAFDRSLILDDANVTGRITLTDATFADDADLSFYGAEIKSFQIEPGQVQRPAGKHRLFYERCAEDGPNRADVRIARIDRDEVYTDDDLRRICYDYAVDEFVALKDSYGSRAMTSAEDDAYWWTRHHLAMENVRFGSPLTKVYTVVVELGMFELCFGWGVRLGNLGIAVIVVTIIFAGLYRIFCPTTILIYDGEDFPVSEVSFAGLCFVSLQTLIAINTGWDFGDDDHRFRWLNTTETLIGYIILTFFVGAYTRMILA